MTKRIVFDAHAILRWTQKEPGYQKVKSLMVACREGSVSGYMNRINLGEVHYKTHSHVVHRMGEQGWTFETVNFMAPAVRVDLFEETVLPAIKAGKVKRFNQFHLSDDMEQKDPTCKPILGYSRSLLYLVSQSFEQGRTIPILGLEKDFNDAIGSKQLPNVFTWAAPGKESKSTTHGGFDDDRITMMSVIAL